MGLAFASSAWLLFASAFFLGFFLVSTSPIGMQYAAEVTHPTPEGTSNGLIQLFGQASVVFVYIMAALQTPDGSFTPAFVAGNRAIDYQRVDCYADERHATKNDDKRKRISGRYRNQIKCPSFPPDKQLARPLFNRLERSHALVSVFFRGCMC